MSPHIHLFDYEHNTRCWCGEYCQPKRPAPKPSNVVRLSDRRQAAQPVQRPCDVETDGAA